MAETTQDDPPDRETLRILDEEIRRLPAKQQAAIVLCLVQGKTHEAAAAELGCPLGTVKSRISGGRATLIRRLSRRGLAPAIATGMAGLSEQLLASSIPHDLHQTLDAATHFAITGSIRGAAITASVQNLIEGVLSTMRLARMKLFAMALAVAGILVGASTVLVLAQTGRARDADQPQPAAKVAPRATLPKLDLFGDPLPEGASMRFGTIRHRQEALIYRIAFTRDDKFIVTDGDDSHLRVWDARDGKLIRNIAVGIEALSDFAISSDGKTVGTAGIDWPHEKGRGFVRQVVFHELATGRELSRGSWAEGLGFPKVALDADRQLLAYGNLGGGLQMIAAMTGAQTAAVVLENEDIKSLEFSLDRKRLLVFSASRDLSIVTLPRLRVFDTTNAREFRLLARFDIDVANDAFSHFVVFSPNGSTIAASDSQKLTFVDVATGTRKELEGEFGRTMVQQMAFSADGQRLAGILASRDTIVFWNPVAKQYVDLLKISSHFAGGTRIFT